MVYQLQPIRDSMTGHFDLYGTGTAGSRIVDIFETKRHQPVDAGDTGEIRTREFS